MPWLGKKKPGQYRDSTGLRVSNNIIQENFSLKGGKYLFPWLCNIVTHSSMALIWLFIVFVVFFSMMAIWIFLYISASMLLCLRTMLLSGTSIYLC